ncbi:MAG: [FeFe] hydrogenase H-cluster maturation GTPase HydF [bacterium]
MQSVPKSERKRVSFFGRTNVGKSSLINALLGQKLSIVSDMPGTTTDPTEKAIEILPAGPLLFTDTPGFDDKTLLAGERIKRTKETLAKTDLAVFVFAPPFKNLETTLQEIEKPYIDVAKRAGIPYIFVINKTDLNDEVPEFLFKLSEERIKLVSSKELTNIEELKAYIGYLLAEKKEIKILEGLVGKNDLIVLVTPVHPAYPKGRLKPLQVQIIREILDSGAIAMETKPESLNSLLNTLNKKPALVITDASTLKEVAELVPIDIPLTTFSMLFARYKGDLKILKDGISRIKSLKSGSKVAIIEACTHHRQEQDLARDLLPVFVNEVTKSNLEYTFISGTYPDFEGLKDVKFALHCGGCMLTRRDMQNRLHLLTEKGIGVLNYGMLIAMKEGLLERTIAPLERGL